VLMPETIYSPHAHTDRIESRHCSRCLALMVLARTAPARLGFDSQTFECVQCSHVEKVLAATDPGRCSVRGWLLGGLKPLG
jgi:hypothetical protein